MGAQVLVVEDEPPILELLAVTLERAGHKAKLVTNAEDALRELYQELPDLVLLDWMLPGRSGVNFARQLRETQRTRSVPIIMLTAKAHENDKLSGLEAGVDDYLTKPFSPRELIARIKAVLRRAAPNLTDDVVEVRGSRLDPAAHSVSAGATTLQLGPTEFRLLHFFLTHRNRVHTRTQILDQVWGDHVFIEERTVDVHIRRLRAALEATGHDSLIETVRGSGYRIRADSGS